MVVVLFHDDSSPRFPSAQINRSTTVSICGASGGLISFIMEYDNMDFVSAVESPCLAVAGLEVPTEANGRSE